MSIEDANSNPTPASAGSCSTAEDVLDEMKSWIQSNDSAKFYGYAVAHIKSKVKRDLLCLEATWMERQYVKIVLEMWLRESLKRAFQYLEDEATDISTEMSVILDELNSINCFEDIRSKLNGATSRLKYWCDGGPLHESPHFKCQYLQLILEQRDLFSTMPRFVILVSSYLKQFKTLCIEKIFSRCLHDIAKEETSGEKNLNFIFALNELFRVADEDIRIHKILEENIYGWENEDQTGQDFVNKLVEIIAISSNAIEKELPQCWFDLLQSDKEWTPRLQLFTKEFCKKLLLPMKTEINLKDEDGRKIIFIYGTTVFISKIIQEMLKLNHDHSSDRVQEIQIVGLTSVHVDCDLESKDWHGINVSVVTHNLYVDRDNILWDVSGKNGNDKVAEGLGTDQAGESGGNVHIIYDEIINAERWTIVCDGGDGSDRLNSGDVEIGPDGEIQKWSKEKFEKAFPSMSTFDTKGEKQEHGTIPHSEKAMKAVLETLEKIVPKQNRTEGTDIQADHTDSFLIKGIAKDGSTITASFYRSMTKRQTLIFCQGSKHGPGEGGFGGTIKFECTGGPETFLKGHQVPFVGKDQREATAVRMGVYEATGTDGFMGIPFGDVGFIHNLDTSLKSAEDNLVGNYIGFDNDVRLKMECTEEKPTRKEYDPKINFYAKLNKTMYASIVPCDDRKFAQVQPLHLAAVKKKANVRENLTQYLAQVNEKKLMMESFQTLLSNPLEFKSSSIDELIDQMEYKEAQLHQLLSQYHQGLEKIGSVKFVKPALKTKTDDVNNALDTSPPLPHGRIIGRRPVDFRSEPPVDVRCLDVLPTVGGVNNVLHCIFGRVNSNGLYVCNNTNTLRQRLAKFIRNRENQTKISTFVEHFVLRMINSYESDFPVACRKKAAYTLLTSDEKDKFNWQGDDESEDLFLEYAKFVESPSSALDLTELKMLAEIHCLTIHVYEEESIYSFKFKVTLNSGRHNQHFILYDGISEWQRLEANLKLEKFCKTLDRDLFESQPIQTDSFQMLMEWLETHHTSEDVITALKNLNPENGDTPDELFRLLLQRLKKYSKQDDEEEEGDVEMTDDHPIASEKEDEEGDVEMTDDHSIALAQDLCYLAEAVLEYNNRNISPIFYLSIVKKYHPQEWKCCFLMLELFNRRATVRIDEDLSKLSLSFLCDIDDRMLIGVASIKNKIAETDSDSALDLEKFVPLLRLLVTTFDTKIIDKRQFLELQELPLIGWIYELKSKMWHTEFDQLSSDPNEKEHKKLKKEAIHMLLELEFKEGNGFGDELIEEMEDLKLIVTKLHDNLYPGKNNPYQKPAQRNVEEIISIMMEDIINENQLKQSKYTRMLNSIQIKVGESKLQSENIEERKIKKLINKWQTTGLELNDQSVVEFLYVYDYAVQQICTNKGDEHKFQLRDTQRVAMTTLLIHKRTTTLTQVSTGEGKSLIVTGVAIAFALSRNKENKNQKIDVITSNDMLALRDSNLSVADGGMRNLYEYFNISVANNCSQSVHNRTKAYNATVVYGQLANFQRDYLMDYFYHHNIRGDRTMDLVIIDEVDCMLLDRGNNTLYLSHDIPGMETLESVYVFIWEKVCTSSIETDDSILKESVKKAVLYDLYGAITKEDLKSIHAQLEDNPSETNALWNYLIEDKIIDAEGHLLMKNGIQKINYQENLNPKIAFYFRKVAERERHIRIPDHLMPFVDRHLNSWIDNAFHALELEIDKDYVVDQDRTDTSPDLNPQVIIIDPDTGTDQISTQWDEALHQFIQLKEGCKLTLQSLKTIFISNATYMKKYEKLAGVSGTLGTKTDRTFMERNYKCLYFVIPTAFEKRFHLKPPKVLKSKETWLKTIIKETEQTILTTDRHEARSVVIFCHSIKSVNLIHKSLKSSELINADNIHCYTRDFEKFAFESQSLEVGHVIVTTNLAGRGTNIKISEKLRKNGGLHICLTFLPKNERIEEQAMGRSARNGAPGSGIFILCDELTHSTSRGGQKWGAGKFVSMKIERQWQESQRMSRFDDDARNIEHEETFFGDFSVDYISTTNELKYREHEDQEIKIICDSILDKWALWLDETVDQLELSFSYYMEEFKDFISEFKLPDNKTANISWMTPVRSVAMAKYLATQKKKTNLSTAADMLKQLMTLNDCFCYPSAFYYYAFVLFRGDLEKDKAIFIRTLRTCESMLNQHVDMELTFYRKVTQTNRHQTPSFCAVDGYKQQKDNTVQLLEYFIGNIRSLLGNNYCCASDLKQAGIVPPKELEFFKRTAKNFKLFYEKNTSRFQPFGKTVEESKKNKICPEKVEKLFHSLVKSTKCTVCKINSSDTIPFPNDIISKVKENGATTKSNLETAIEQVAYDYGVSASTLNKTLDLVFKMGLAEKDIEKELEKQIEEKLEKESSILCTRKSFWKKLVDEEALQVIDGGKCSNMKCVIVSEKDCEIEPKLDVANRSITLDFGFDTNYNLDEIRNIYVLFNPTYANRTELERGKKLIFSKQYVEDTLTEEEYLQRKTIFEYNKIAKLNIENLKKVNLNQFGRLGRDDLSRVKIDSSEQKRIWNALVEQNIIDKFGNLSSEYDDQQFSYSDCPAYEDTVMRLVGRKFAAEIVKRHWLKAAEKHLTYEGGKDCKAKQETDEKNLRLKAIDVLPLKPYRDMLSDLMAAHVISGTRVTEDASIDLEEEVKKIENVDEEECKCIVEFLRSRQPVYAPRMKDFEIVLDFIEADVRNIPKLNNISSELYIFDLVGLNQVIGIKDRERSWKMVCLTSAISTIIIAGGAASVGVGAFLVYSKILKFGICKNLFFSGGLSDILYAVTTILTRSNFTWADFTRQRLRSVIGKAEPIDKIKTILELLNSHETSDQDLKNAIKMTIEWERRMRQSRKQITAQREAFLSDQTQLIKPKNKLSFHSRLHSQCLLLCDFLKAQINKIIDKNSVKIKETLAQLHRLQGQQKARFLTDERIKAIAVEWFKDGCEWVSELEITITSKLVEIGENRQTGGLLIYEVFNSDIQSIEQILEDLNTKMRMVCKTRTHLQTFILDVNKDNLLPSPSTADDFDVEENKRFLNRAMTDLKCELARKAEKVVEILTQKVHQITSDHITQLTNTNP